ncbi:universal stress protein [Streptomyces sp. NWU339]|uniref:universal stress protein n=1 Tax=Streptomyces sp. NWU339 TaxID=2185284 RepID=UPI0026D3029D
MTRPIPAGVDGSEESFAAPAWAGREAERRGLPLRPVHAWRFEVHDAFDAGDRDTRRRGCTTASWRPPGPSPNATST